MFQFFATKLSETYPLVLGDLPSSRQFPSETEMSFYREGLYVGYRYTDKVGIKVAYPYGYGLSYTQFSYSQLQVTDTGVQLLVTNTGEYDGSEIIQLYVGKKESHLYRPQKELKGFAKVFLKVGESRLVTILFDDKTFRYYDIESQTFEVERGLYQLYLASHSQDIRLEGEIFQQGTRLPSYQKESLSSYYSGQVAEVSDEEFERLLGRKLPKEGWQKGQALQQPLI